MYTAVGVDEDAVGQTIDYIVDHVLPPTASVGMDNSAQGPLVVDPSVIPSDAYLTQRNAQLSQLRKDVTDYLLALGNNARTLGVLTISILFFIGVMLLNTIESALNAVWRVTSGLSSVAQKMVTFWAVITFGPVFILLSIYLTTKAQGFGISSTALDFGLIRYTHTIGAVVVSTFALTLLYFTLPAAKVRLRDAVFGAFFASLLFEVLKKGFAYYLSVSSGYSSLYGVLASVPLFLFWLYLTWVVILLGAEASYLSGKLDILSTISQYRTQMGEMGGLLGLRVLLITTQRYLDGKPLPTEGELSVETGVEPSLIRLTLDYLTSAELLSQNDPKMHTRTLMRSPEHIRVSEVLDTFRISEAGNKDLQSGEVSKDSDGGDVFLEFLRNTTKGIDSAQKVRDASLKDLAAIGV
jgi:YihY family inner membrane protein